MELVTAYSKGQNQAALDKIKEKFSKAVSKFRYGFSSIADDSNVIAKIGQTDAFKRFKECVGSKYWAVNFCRIGLYVAEMNNIGRTINIEEIKKEAWIEAERKGVNVINMGSTGIIKDIIGHLSELKIKEDFTRVDLQKEFEQFVKRWNYITVFVEKDDLISTIEKEILDHIKAREKIFWVFGYSSAVNLTHKAIAKLNKAKQILQKDYLWIPTNIEDGAKNKVFHCKFKLCKF